MVSRILIPLILRSQIVTLNQKNITLRTQFAESNSKKLWK